MTPQPPSSPDGSGLPPRHRPNMGNLSKDTTEMDLWAFDDVDAPEDPPEVKAPKTAKSAESAIPAARGPEKGKPRTFDETDASSAGESALKDAGKESVRVNVSKNRARKPATVPVPGQSKAGSEFDDLDSWEETDTPSPAEISPTAKAAAQPAVDAPPEESPVAREVAGNVSAASEPPAAPSPVEPAASKGLGIRLGLSGVERVGLILLVAILVIGAGAAYLYTINRLPKEANLVKSHDFPISGKHAVITRAESYWRAPVTEGPNPDTFRRDTQLLPILNLESGGEPATIRVFFRDGNGELVGDSVTRPVRSGTKLEIAATAGFDDIGMYAAYRTGQSKPWTIEVFEAPGDASQAKDFNKLFEMRIATDSR